MNGAAVLELCASGAISPHIALTRLLLTGRAPDPAALARAAAERPDAPALVELAALAERHRARLEPLSRLAGLELMPESDVLTRTAALFDRLAEEAPEAGVALYSFGDADELALATAEVVSVIERWSPSAGRHVLDLGCGIGRVAHALAAAAADVLGVDLSGGMIDEARRRGASGARFEQSDGRRIPAPSGSVDLLVAVDSLPYVVQAGAVDEVAAEAARVVRPGGDFLAFNWSYRGDVAADVAEAHAVAARHGFFVARAGERPFTIWDGLGFHLVRQ